MLLARENVGGGDYFIQSGGICSVFQTLHPVNMTVSDCVGFFLRCTAWQRSY